MDEMNETQTKQNDFGFLFWLHLLGILLIYLSPWLVAWRVIVGFVFLYYLQLLIFGTCILTGLEFGIWERKKASFWGYYLSKFGFKINHKRLVIVLDFVVPWVIFSVALVLQIGFDYVPYF